MASRPIFQLMTGKEQAAFLTSESYALWAPQCLQNLNSQGPVPCSQISSRMRSLLARSRLIRHRLKTSPSLPWAIIADLRNNASQVSCLIKLCSTQDSLASKKHLHALLQQGGARSQCLFWSLINLAPKTPPAIEVLSSNGTLTVIPAELRSIMKEFISVKFNTSFSPVDITWELVGAATLDPPVRSLSREASDNLVSPFTMSMLASALCTLDCFKSEGLDQVTNAMIRNTGQVAREMMLSMFNNVLVGVSPRIAGRRGTWYLS